MAWRVTEQEVRTLIETDPDLSIAPFVDAANALTDYVSSQDSASVLTTALLVQIEKYLAAYYYAIRDLQYASKKTEKASATFQGAYDLGFDLNQWGVAAKSMDVSGTLAAIDKGVTRVSAEWLGLPPSEQTDYVDRD